MTPELTELTARRLGPIRRYFVQHPIAMDLLVMAWFGVPAILTLLVGMPTGIGEAEGAAAVQGVVALVAVVLGTAALWWRRRRPLLVLTVLTVLGVVVVMVTAQTVGFDLAVGLGVYAVAVSRSPAAAWMAAALSVLLLGGAQVLVQAPEDLSTFPPSAGSPSDWDVFRVTSAAFIVVWALVALAIGFAVRNRRAHIQGLVDRANQLALERDQGEQLAVAAERARIAREMHDVVAHSLSVMITLADGAQAIIDTSPERARAAMDDVAETGRTALGDMRRVLGALRDDDGDAGARLEPQPTDGLAELVDRFRAAGLAVELTTSGDPLPTDAGLRLAVYRIVQEALTNVLRYAPLANRIQASVARSSDGVVVEVTNTGGQPGAAQPQGTGQGLIGMRERVAVFGGTLEAGPTPSGWRVRAVLPWREGVA